MGSVIWICTCTVKGRMTTSTESSVEIIKRNAEKIFHDLTARGDESFGDVVQSLLSNMTSKLGLQNDGEEAATYRINALVVLRTVKSVFGFASSAVRGGDPSLLSIQNQISVVDGKIDKILAAPIKMANQHYETALREIQFGKCDQAQETLNKVIDEAMRAFHYTMENGMSVETFQECLKAIKLQVFAKVLKYSYNPDQKYFQPLNTLSGINKSMIAEELESLVKQCIEASKQIPVNAYVPGAYTQKSSIQDTLDQILKLTYPYLSFGFGWTNNKISTMQLTHGGEYDRPIHRKITESQLYSRRRI